MLRLKYQKVFLNQNVKIDTITSFKVFILENIGDKMLNMIEQNLINPTSDKQEVMNMCLTSTKGDYQPISVPIAVTPSPQSTPSKKQQAGSKSNIGQIRTHVPGKAGGGWESSEDEEEIQMKQLEELSIQSPNSDSMVEQAIEVSEEK